MAWYIETNLGRKIAGPYVESEHAIRAIHTFWPRMYAGWAIKNAKFSRGSDQTLWAVEYEGMHPDEIVLHHFKPEGR